MAISGLTEREAEASRQKYGLNVRSYKSSLLRGILGGFSGLTSKLFVISALIGLIAFMLGLLGVIPPKGTEIFVIPAAAAVLSAAAKGALGHCSDIMLNRAARSSENGVYAVFRGIDKTVELRAEELVVGDLVYVTAEDVIPADGIIVSGEMTVDQAVFGVIGRIRKSASPDGYKDSGMFIPESPYCVYSGSTVCKGGGIVRITAIGDGTQLAKRMEEKPVDIPEQSFSEMLKVGGWAGIALAAVSVAVCAFMGAAAGDLITGILRGASVGAAALAVSCIGRKSLACRLCAAAAIKRLAARGVTVSKPEALVTAAETDVLLTGKTGIFTRGEYVVSGFIDGSGKEYASFGDIEGSLGTLLKTAVVSIFSAQLLPDGTVRGRNPFDSAMLEFVKKSVKASDVLKKQTEASRDGLQGATVSLGGELLTIVRGESEKLLERCTDYHGTDGRRHKITNKEAVQQLADAISLSGKDVEAIAVTGRSIKGGRLPESGLTLIGLIALQDRYCEESAEWVKRLSTAGVRTVLVTGGSRENAVFTAKYAGIKKKGGVVLTSKQLYCMGDKELEEKLKNIRVVSCAAEHDKLRLLKAARSRGEQVCFAGAIMRDIKVLSEADTAFAASSAASSVRSVCAAAAEKCGIRCAAEFMLISRRFASDYRFFLTARVVLAAVTAAGLIFGMWW